MRWTRLAGPARTLPAALLTSFLHGSLGRATMGLLAFLLPSFGWGSSATAASYPILLGDVKPNQRAEFGAGRASAAVKLGFPMVERFVVETAWTTSGRADRGFALRDGIWFGIGERPDAFFGYELMLGYRAAGLGLLAGALGGYHALMLGEFRHGWRYRAQVRGEVPCPWTRVPFSINLRWDPSSDGAAGAQLVVPIAWSFGAYVDVQRTTSVVSEEEGTTVSTTSIRSQQVLFGVSLDMFEHFRVRRPSSR